MKQRGFIDLHLHLDGSLSLKTVRRLADEQNISLPEDDAELLGMLQVGPDCRDLNQYLEKFDLTCSLMQTKEAITTAVSDLCATLKDQGLLYAEIRFAPQLHVHSGLTQSQVVQAAIDGLAVHAFRANLILCCMRGDSNQKENLETVEVASEFLGKGVCAVDLAGAEALYHTDTFEDLFRVVEEKKLPRTIHAGEASGPESVWKALEFGAQRLGHGVRSIEDPNLIHHLAEIGVTLELCPTSNLNTCVFEKLEDYPLLQLIEAGVAVTVNTDNMTVSGVTLESEMEKLACTLHLTDEHFKTLASNAARASFASVEDKQWMLDQIASV